MAKVKLRWKLAELEAFDKLGDDGSDTLLRRRWKRGSWLGVWVSENDPQAGAVTLVAAGADGAGQLCEFERQRGRVSEIEHGVLRRVRLVGRMGKEIHENAAGVVDQVAKALRDKDGVHIAGRRLLELEKVIIVEWILERNFDSGGRLVLVRGDSNGHDGYGFTLRGLFRIGAAGENGKGAVELLGEYDASEFVGEGHGAEREFLVGPLLE
jgi:hypothetical protein